VFEEVSTLDGVPAPHSKMQGVQAKFSTDLLIPNGRCDIEAEDKRWESFQLPEVAAVLLWYGLGARVAADTWGIG
jgi:hypothetical protein